MCKYYQVGRFSELGSEEFDEGSAFYHLELAAELAVREAIFASAKIYLDLPRDLLPNFRPTVKKFLFICYYEKKTFQLESSRSNSKRLSTIDSC